MSLKYIDYELIEHKEREQAYEDHKDEMGQADAETGDAKNDDVANMVDAELKDAKIECTQDIFGRVLNQLDEEQEKLKIISKF